MKKKSRFLDKLVLPYFIILMIIITMVMLLVYSTAVFRMKNNILNTQIQLSETTAQRVDEYISELEMLAEQINKYAPVRSLFYSLQNDDDMSDYFEKNVMESIDYSLAIRNFIPANEDTYNICIYNDRGDFLSTNSYCVDTAVKRRELEKGDISSRMRQMLTGKSFIVSGPQKNIWTNEIDTRYVTYTTILRNEYSDYPCGIIEIRCNVSKFAQKLDTVNTPGVMICDRSSGEILFPINHSGSENTAGMLSARCEKANWEVLMPRNSNEKGLYSVQLILLFIGIYAVLALFMIQLLRLVGKHVTKPLEVLTESVRHVRNIDSRLVIDEYSAMDEVKELEKSFEKLIERMQSSVEQEKKAYALAMQAQMNPHFLYNTLSVISSAGSESGSEAVTNMCVELSNMLRYVTDFTTINVALKDEIEHTRSYLTLMKYRYEEYFTYDIHIDEELLNISVPKLCIQPLVENCFKHGFKGKSLPWNISVKMTGSYREWVLEIKDNGVGMTEERIIEVKNIISNALSDMISSSIGGIGLCNTIIRLKMTLNEKLNYDLINDNGLKVVIRGKQ